MAKPYRGKGLINLFARGRGTCPICKATRIKVLYERETPEGARVKVCKRCRRKPFPASQPVTIAQLPAAQLRKEPELARA